ncbi:MAG: polysaccharide biosynthesis/export family protein [Beijerinckiaceae bacterium]
MLTERRRLSVVVMACLSLALAACSPAGGGMTSFTTIETQPNALPANLRPGVAGSGIYQVATGDVLEVSVFQAPNLNRTVEVDGAGNVVLALVGPVHVAGKTIRQAEAEIAKKLGAKYLQSPDVTIFVKDSVGQRVTVDGAVRKTGYVQAKGDMTLLRVLAESGGFTETADQAAVMIFRPTEKGRMVARFDANAIRLGQAPDPPVYGGDTVIVDDSVAKTAWKQFREVLPIAGFFRLF